MKKNILLLTLVGLVAGTQVQTANNQQTDYFVPLFITAAGAGFSYFMYKNFGKPAMLAFQKVKEEKPMSAIVGGALCRLGSVVRENVLKPHGSAFYENSLKPAMVALQGTKRGKVTVQPKPAPRPAKRNVSEDLAERVTVQLQQAPQPAPRPARRISAEFPSNGQLNQGCPHTPYGALQAKIPGTLENKVLTKEKEASAAMDYLQKELDAIYEQTDQNTLKLFNKELTVLMSKVRNVVSEMRKVKPANHQDMISAYTYYVQLITSLKTDIEAFKNLLKQKNKSYDASFAQSGSYDDSGEELFAPIAKESPQGLPFPDQSSTEFSNLDYKDRNWLVKYSQIASKIYVNHSVDPRTLNSWDLIPATGVYSKQTLMNYYNAHN